MLDAPELRSATLPTKLQPPAASLVSLHDVAWANIYFSLLQYLLLILNAFYYPQKSIEKYVNWLTVETRSSSPA